MSDHCNKKKVTVTSGPFYVPPVNSLFLGFIPLYNNKIVVSLKNPTCKQLDVHVTLGICKPCDSGYAPPPINGSVCHVQKVKTMEQEINLGWHKIDPMSCLRLEKLFDNYDLGNSVVRVEAKGDFKVDHDSYNLIGGLLEISSLAGFLFEWGAPSLANLTPEATAALQAAWLPNDGLTFGDASTFIPYGDYVYVKDGSYSSYNSSSSYSDDD